MIESLRDMTHMSSSYENLDKERTANKLFHRMEDRVNDDSLDATRARILGMSHHGPRHQTLILFSERSNDLRPESMSRRDKLRANFLTKDWRRHRRTQSND
jgi:hypothetical protein